MMVLFHLGLEEGLVFRLLALFERVPQVLKMKILICREEAFRLVEHLDLWVLTEFDWDQERERREQEVAVHNLRGSQEDGTYC